MNPHGELVATPDGSHVDRLRAVGSFIWLNAARARAAASREGSLVPNFVVTELRGGSMGSAIPARSRIRIEFSPPPYQVDEVIATMLDADIVVHRVVHRQNRGSNDDRLITRGDAMILPDPPIETDAVLGRVTKFAVGNDWQSPGACARKPRRERFLAFLILVASVFLLHIRVSWARRFIVGLRSADSRFAWTRALLY